MSTPATPFALPEAVTIWTAISLALAVVAGIVARKWSGADKRQKEQDETLENIRAALDRARKNGDLPRQCTLLRKLQEYMRQHGLPADP